MVIAFNLHPFNTILSFRKRKKTYSAKSCESGGSWRFWHMMKWFSFYSSLNRQKIKLSATWRTFRLSYKMLWTDSNKIPSMLASSCIVILPFFRTSSITWSMFSPVLLPHWLFDYVQSIYHFQQRSYHFVSLSPLKKLCSSHCLLSKCYFHIKKMSVPFSPSLKQNLIWTHCSFKSAIV